MTNLEVIFPEIFLTLSIFAVLMVGVFLKNTYGLVNKICVLIIICTGFLVFYSNETLEKIFLDSFIRDKFSNFIKILILISSLFVLFASQNFIKDMKISKNIDDKMWRLYGHCFDCQIDFEHKLRVEGKYDEWEKTKVLENKKAFIKDQIQSVEEWITQSPLKFLNQTAIDTRVIDEEKWEDNIDRPKVGGEAIEEFQKELEKIEKELKDIYNQGE